MTETPLPLLRGESWNEMHASADSGHIQYAPSVQAPIAHLRLVPMEGTAWHLANILEKRERARPTSDRARSTGEEGDMTAAPSRHRERWEGVPYSSDTCFMH